MTLPGLTLHTEVVDWPFSEPFVISRGPSRSETLLVTLTDRDGCIGRGEATGISYHGDTPASLQAELAAVTPAIERGIDRRALLELLPPGGARHAMDAALWDLEAKRGEPDPFTAAGLRPDPVQSDLTIGIRSLEAYEETARRAADFPWLKVKVGTDDPLAAVEAVRRGAPRAKLLVDANQAWSVDQLKALAPRLADLGVELLEQPIPVGVEAALDGYACPVRLAADELIGDESDLAKALGRFQVVNIKLDKTGGLTAALALADAAEAMGFGLMVGSMSGSSLAMAPSMVLAQRCANADLDVPMLLVRDCEPGFTYENGLVRRPHLPELWG